MKAHLEDACQSCGRLLGLFTRIHEDGAAEPQVPAHLIAAAKAVFPGRPPTVLPDWLSFPRLAAQLVFDSSSQFLPQGARSASEATVQLVYEAGDYAIELQIERESDCDEMILLGMVSNRASARPLEAGVPVLLAARNHVIGRSETNRSGEFCITFPMQPAIKLRLPLEEIGRLVEIPLVRNLAALP
jgi:hypothetical protein